MTTTATPTEIEIDHPVRSFVLVLLAASLLLLGLQVTGAVHPNLQTPGSGGSTSGDVHVFMVEVRNASALPIRVEEVTWPTHGMSSVELGLAPTDWLDGGASLGQGLGLGALTPLEPFSIDGWSSRWIAITVVPACNPSVGEPKLRVRTPLGIVRTTDVPYRQAQEEIPAIC